VQLSQYSNPIVDAEWALEPVVQGRVGAAPWDVARGFPVREVSAPSAILEKAPPLLGGAK
jgi:hypothetical protein